MKKRNFKKFYGKGEGEKYKDVETQEKARA